MLKGEYVNEKKRPRKLGGMWHAYSMLCCMAVYVIWGVAYMVIIQFAIIVGLAVLIACVPLLFVLVVTARITATAYKTADKLPSKARKHAKAALNTKNHRKADSVQAALNGFTEHEIREYIIGKYTDGKKR